MKISTIIFIFLTIVFIVYLVWSAVEWIKWKRIQNTIIRHFIDGKEIGKAHKFSEAGNCEVCSHPYINKTKENKRHGN